MNLNWLWGGGDKHTDWHPWEGVNGAAKVVDFGILSTSHNRYQDTIGYNVLGTVTWTEAENVRRFRLLPSVDMRYVVDASNDTIAGAWLNQNAAQSGAADTDVEYRVALAGVWSEWQEYSRNDNDGPISRVDFISNAAGTGATVHVEAE